MVGNFEGEKHLEDLSVDTRKRPPNTALVKRLRSGSIKGQTTGIECKPACVTICSALQSSVGLAA
jgi:hypothetical protein